MASVTEDLEKDESFVVKAISQKKKISDLARELSDYFNNYYELSPVEIKFDEVAKNWIVKTKKGTKEVEYPEAIPKVIADFRS